jgi:hypothetical protein
MGLQNTPLRTAASGHKLKPLSAPDPVNESGDGRPEWPSLAIRFATSALKFPRLTPLSALIASIRRNDFFI